ncbi:hypothetical protein J6590_056741 [Homalodisca vitripennis]|nr:hypothetical protein J6590_056741 [Homalodisca vitripennis]
MKIDFWGAEDTLEERRTVEALRYAIRRTGQCGTSLTENRTELTSGALKIPWKRGGQ